ncbi:hypothetical protein [Azospirillum sp. TSO22-1]|uniref:hypothetical protein n=1 Tax=Azospirillum sp. TSO22-1 TaxID=716789 RepID=UPI000D6149CC|nr:hypothetical protein [Azospirillum sp. TSO22-1]PWC40675.1 hypothetical protein TSO221_24745 [Azospirillum sp. TSO22-1]
MTPGPFLRALDSRLAAEKPELAPMLRAYRDADRLLRRMGLLPRGESLATRARWWPLIVVLGAETPARVAFLEGIRPAGAGPSAALYVHGAAPAGDLRIPAGLPDGLRAVASDSPRLRGRLLLDVAGDAAPPAGAVIEQADLVLLFADADQPDSEALVEALAAASRRADAGKLLTVRSEAGLADIDARLAEAAAACDRRTAGLLDAVAEEVEDELVPYLQAALARWRRGVRRGALVWTALLALVLGSAVALAGTGNVPAFAAWLGEAAAAAGGAPVRLLVLAAGVGGLWLAGHQWVRRVVAQRVAAELPARMGEADLSPRRAFLRGTGPFRRGVAGWGRGARRRLTAIRAAIHAAARANP